VPESKLEAFKEDPSMNPLSLLNPDIAILPFVNFFSAPTESTTAKKSPSASAVEVVSKFKSILAIGTVPLAKLEAFKDVKLAPLTAGNVAGNLASGTVPLAKLEAFKFVSAEPFAAGSVAGNLASGKVPEAKLSAFKSVMLNHLLLVSVAGNLASGIVPEVKLSGV
jgi:hypothetical protein